jgi:hypothetical protein
MFRPFDLGDEPRRRVPRRVWLAAVVGVVAAVVTGGLVFLLLAALGA